ncbi:MAG: hypothetical protein JXB40_00890 [Candidatus Omnitrophica bacterium]|nr:hypothetical protein [Candidatus Omnitrophota bacterium]
MNKEWGILKAGRYLEEDDIDFEISFYEDVIRESPDHVNALFLLGDAYTKKGLYAKGLEMDLRLANLLPTDPTIRYNLACDYSLLKRSDSCIEALEKAIKFGYRAFKHMDRDPDLEYIRRDARYGELLLRYRKSRARR